MSDNEYAKTTVNYKSSWTFEENITVFVSERPSIYCSSYESE